MPEVAVHLWRHRTSKRIPATVRATSAISLGSCTSDAVPPLSAVVLSHIASAAVQPLSIVVLSHTGSVAYVWQRKTTPATANAPSGPPVPRYESAVVLVAVATRVPVVGSRRYVERLSADDRSERRSGRTEPVVEVTKPIGGGWRFVPGGEIEPKTKVTIIL